MTSRAAIEQASPVPGDANRGVIRAGLDARAKQGWLGSEAVDELADTLDLVSELEAIGAISPAFARKLIRDLADEQARLWADDHALPTPGVC